MKILIVDDNIENIDIMMILLKSKNYKVTSAGNGQEALKKLHSEKFDLIISDILMPVMDGFQLCRECKKKPELVKICFIFYTATYTDDKDEEFALSLGAQKFIRKPQEQEVFLNLIKEAVEKSGNKKNIPKIKTNKDEIEELKLYSERLVTKLKKKTLDLEYEIASYKRTVNELKESEEKYKTLFTVAQEAIFIAEVETGTLLDCNEAACSLIERTKEEIVGKHQSFLHPPDELVDEYTESFQEHILNEPENVLSAYVITKSGTIKDVEIKAKVLNIKGKKIIQGFFEDVTKRKRAEENLLIEQHLLNSLIENTPDNIYFKDSESRFIRINNMMAKKFGLNDLQEAIGKTDFDFFGEGHARPAFEDEQRIIATGEPIVGLEEKEVWMDGHITWVSTTKMPLMDKTGKIIGIMGISRDITERKMAEETIQKERTLLKTLIDNLPSAVFVKDKNYRKTLANAIHVSSMAGHMLKLGMNPEIDLIGKTDFEIYPKEMAENYFADDKKVINDGQSIINKEEEGYSPEGKPIWLLISKIPIRDTNGEINGMIGITTDITERKLAAETIAKERTLLRTLIDNLPVGVFVKDNDYKKIIVNPIHVKEIMGHLKYLGLNTEIDILGKTDFQVFSKKLATKLFADDQKIIRDGSVILNKEGLGYYEDGNQQWLQVSKIPLRDKNGEITGMVGVTTDITERRHVEEALKNSEEKFRTIFNNASDGMFLHDPEVKKNMMCNQACLKMLGYSDDEFLNLNVADIHPSEELPFVFEQIEKIYRGEVGVRTDIKFKRKDSTIFTADLGPTLVTIAGKRFVLIVFRDITEHLLIEDELRLAKEKAEESDSLKTAFLHNISHEIRTPLNGIIGFSDMITNPNLSFEKREQFSKIIRNSGDQLLSIVNDIINIATIEAGHAKHYEKESNINKLLQLIKNQNSLMAESKGLSFTVSSSLTDDEANVLVDETKLLQILSNLANNAIKFTLEGYIKVNCRLEDNFLKFTFEDTGIGIPTEMHEKIFHRFFQIDHADTRLYGGTGLGLSIVQSYVYFLEGAIHLDSKPGKGSVFIISIPFKPVMKRKHIITPAHHDIKQIGSATVLIAEDEKANFELLNTYLSDLDFTIIYAANGIQAIEICRENPSISLVLMDVKMPKMDGYEAARQIKSFRPTLPIIIQTAYVFQNEREKSMSSYVDGYIEKPINQNVLLETLRSNLNK